MTPDYFARNHRAPCVVDGCERPYVCRRMCNMHYLRLRIHGDPGPAEPYLASAGHAKPRVRKKEAFVSLPVDRADMREKFWTLVDVGHPAGCWQWSGRLDKAGYGRFARATLAHRFSYVLLMGHIPARLELDHQCRNRRCVNPDHLEPVTREEHTRRSAKFAGRRPLATHCKHGHAFSADNTVIRGGHRRCRQCERARGLENYYRRKAAGKI